jgi:hypothetical protein
VQDGNGTSVHAKTHFFPVYGVVETFPAIMPAVLCVLHAA